MPVHSGPPLPLVVPVSVRAATVRRSHFLHAKPVSCVAVQTLSEVSELCLHQTTASHVESMSMRPYKPAALLLSSLLLSCRASP